MTKGAAILLFISIFLLVVIPKNYASDSLANRNLQAVLVQLRSEHNRIIALTAAERYADVETVKRDALGVKNAMINDFEDHFHFCPVYYYMDTNLDLVLHKKFEGVLLNADGSPVKKPVVNDSGSKYLIVYYGYPVEQSRRTKEVNSPEKYQYNSGEPMGEGLIINNMYFHQISYLYKFGFDNLIFRMFYNHKYIYTSKKFEMEYFPFAQTFNKDLFERRKRIRKKHINGATGLAT